MRRAFVVIVLICSAFWQGLAIGGRASAFENSEVTMHAMLHWQARAHHHHEDGSVTVDSSSESVQHVVADGVLGASAVGSEPKVALPQIEAVGPIVADERSGTSPHLAGPRRPPRLAA